MVRQRCPGSCHGTVMGRHGAHSGATARPASVPGPGREGAAWAGWSGGEGGQAVRRTEAGRAAVGGPVAAVAGLVDRGRLLGVCVDRRTCAQPSRPRSRRSRQRHRRRALSGSVRGPGGPPERSWEPATIRPSATRQAPQRLSPGVRRWRGRQRRRGRMNRPGVGWVGVGDQRERESAGGIGRDLDAVVMAAELCGSRTLRGQADRVTTRRAGWRPLSMILDTVRPPGCWRDESRSPGTGAAIAFTSHQCNV
ncbi:hypothetical protein ABH931_002681 [Streptacidiphilus sp. MAP12-33]